MPQKRSEARRLKRSIQVQTETAIRAHHRLKRQSDKDLYREQYADQVGKLPPPLTNSQVAEFFDISIQTFHNWKNKHPKFAEAIRRAKDKVDDVIVNALFERSRGFEHDSEKVFLSRSGKIIRAKTREKYAPDTAATSLWLRNRQSGEWRDKQLEMDEGEAPVPVKIEINFRDARRKKE